MVEVEIDEYVGDILGRVRDDCWVREIRYFGLLLFLNKDRKFEVWGGGCGVGGGFV